MSKHPIWDGLDHPGRREKQKMSNPKKIAAGDNSVSARLSATVRNGTFKGSVKLPTGTCRFEGAFLRDGKSVYGIGVSYGAGVYLVEIGDARK